MVQAGGEATGFCPGDRSRRIEGRCRVRTKALHCHAPHRQGDERLERSVTSSPCRCSTHARSVKPCGFPVASFSPTAPVTLSSNTVGRAFVLTAAELARRVRTSYRLSVPGCLRSPRANVRSTKAGSAVTDRGRGRPSGVHGGRPSRAGSKGRPRSRRGSNGAWSFAQRSGPRSGPRAAGTAAATGADLAKCERT